MSKPQQKNQKGGAKPPLPYKPELALILSATEFASIEPQTLKPFAALIIRTQESVVEASTITQAQSQDCAVVIEGSRKDAAILGADGWHTPAGQDIQRINDTHNMMCGYGPCQSRHDALEAAENGADYVLFDGSNFEKTLKMAQWWSEVCTAPCVAVAKSWEEAQALKSAHVDFIALGIWALSEPDKLKALP